MTGFFNDDTLRNTGVSMFEDKTKKKNSGNEITSEELEEMDIHDEEEITDDDIKLAQLGMRCYYGTAYKKRYPRNDIFNSSTKQPNKKFFQYYLDNCDADMLARLREHKETLSKGLKKMLEEAEPVEVVYEDNESDVSKYIDKNKELIQQLTDVKAELRLFEGATKFLFQFMSNKTCIFDVKELEIFVKEAKKPIERDDMLNKIIEIKNSIEIDDEDINVISEIKEMIK